MKLHHVEVQIEKPTADFPGRTVQGIYTFEEGVVTLTGRAGVPVRDTEGNTYCKKLDAGEDPHLVAGRLTRQLRKALRGDKKRPAGFAKHLHYPKLGIV